MSDKSSVKTYAVVETGGKQYLVHEGDTLRVEILSAKTGDKVDLAPVLALSYGGELKIGKPHLKGIKVTATVVAENVKAKKVVAFKKKRRKGYRKKQGHRQQQTVLKVESIR